MQRPTPALRHVPLIPARWYTSLTSVVVRVLVGAVLVPIAIAHGQGISVSGTAARRAQWQTAQVAGPVRITPALATVDPTTHSATVQFINTSDDTAHAAVTVQTAAPLASWIRDLPTQVTLAPHETLTVHVHLVIPPTLKPGTYTAALVVTPPVGTPAGPVTVSGDGTPGQGGGVQKGGEDAGTLVGADGHRASVQMSLGSLTASDRGGTARPSSHSRSTLVYHVGYGH